MNFEFKKITVSRFFVFFVSFMLIVSIATGAYVYMRIKAEEEAEEAEKRKVAQQQSLHKQYEDRYSLMLSGMEVPSLLRVVSGLLSAADSLSGIGKSVNGIDCSYRHSGKEAVCNMLFDSTSGPYSTPDIFIENAVIKPVIADKKLSYSDITFKDINNSYYEKFLSEVQIDAPVCNDFLGVLGQASLLLASTGGKMVNMAPSASSLKNINNPGLNDSLYFGEWTYEGNIQDIPVMYFINDNMVVKSFTVNPGNNLIVLKGNYSCIAN